MQKPVLIVMAAGMGKRYGSLKQVDPVGGHGQTLMEYSLYDAKRAGFEEAVFIVSEKMQEDFQGFICRIGDAFSVRMAVQSLQDIPSGFSVPEGREKPWGTGHAVLAARDIVQSPFAVINADDYYGPSGFSKLFEFLMRPVEQQKEYAMIGYQLCNTLSENGSVARGVCQMDADGWLLSIKETKHIIATCDGALFTEDGQRYQKLADDTLASMNIWGFPESFLSELSKRFVPFLEKAKEDPLGAEYFLPDIVGEIIGEGTCKVSVLLCEEKWFGMTYAKEREAVKGAIRKMTQSGLYPDRLWT